MPQKRTLPEENNVSAVVDSSKRQRAEVTPGKYLLCLMNISPTHLPIFEGHAVVRQSSRSGKGIGGQIAQMRSIEQAQTGAPRRPRRLTDLDSATQGEEVNPMAPSHLEQESGSQTIENPHSGRPRPRLRRGPLSAAASQIAPPAPSPIFSLATPGQQFGFKLPGTGQVASSQVKSSGSVDSLYSSSRASTTFSNASRPSTAPTSRVPSVCPSSQGDTDFSQQPHTYGFSSHLKRLASASQHGVKTPTRISRASSGTATSFSRDLPADPPEGQLVSF